MEARDEAEVEELPGAECSARIVVRLAMQVLHLDVSFHAIELDDVDSVRNVLEQGARGLG